MAQCGEGTMATRWPQIGHDLESDNKFQKQMYHVLAGWCLRTKIQVNHQCHQLELDGDVQIFSSHVHFLVTEKSTYQPF